MSASPAPAETEAGTSALLRTLLLCDLVGSTALVEKLGDRAAAELIRKHDRMARTVADRHGGREIDKTDGFLMMFERPIQAVAFALDYQRGLRQLNAAEHASLVARVGIHVGDVVVWDNAPEDIAKGAKPIEVEGLVKPVASRLMNLALPGQILLSNIAYALAHRAQGELGVQLERVRWRTYGRYRFKGIPDPIPVFEVGEEGTAPLKAPPWSGKAHREIPFWRRPATVVIEALILAVLVAIPIYTFFKPEPAIAFASRDWVVVGNLNNLTGETVFDEALESALRIALEQSRYVNVLPDLKVRDTIKRMERDPDATRIDRVIGSEVAIRDGVKALILPTIAEVGGRVRITAEVVDPHTQTTVYSESADGVGAESVLPSLDLVNQRLRVRLGEALATVSNDSLPLERVATGNLDALRAYSLASNHYVQGKFQESLDLYRQALRIDPAFASVHMRVAGILVSMGRDHEAAEELEKALANRQRLAQRDAMYAEAFVASLQRSKDATSKWVVLTEIYPDYFTGLGGFAYLAWRDDNRFDDRVVAMAQSGASEKNPRPLPSLHLLGILQLGRERYADAITTLTRVEASGLPFTQYHAAALAAQRRFADARTVLSRTPMMSAVQNANASGVRTLLEAAFVLDENGDAGDAISKIRDDRDAVEKGHVLIGMLDVAMLGIDPRRDERSDAGFLGSIRDQIGRAKGERKSSGRGVAPALDLQLLFLGYLAANAGQVELAKTALDAVDRATYSDSDGLSRLRKVVEAEVARVSGQTKVAITALEAMRDGNEPYLSHIVSMEAYADASRPDLAFEQAEWLARHRGRAYAEAFGNSQMMVFNVQASVLANLRSAELRLQHGDNGGARRALETFTRSWRDPSSVPQRKRVERLQSLLP